MRTVAPPGDLEFLDEAASALRRADCAVALTGAGISVESGIPDFRSPGGLWSRFDPGEYATLAAFQHSPSKAWKLYRALGEILVGTEPNAGHGALSELERAGMLKGLITQNVDCLHQAAGSRNVIEIHGEHRNLHCLRCGDLEPMERAAGGEEVPCCRNCGDPLKPNVVLFGESTRGMDDIAEVLERCDLLLVVGTSASVFPAADIPRQVMNGRGTVMEFNLEETALTRGASLRGPFAAGAGERPDFFFRGSASSTLPLLARAAIDRDQKQHR